MNNFINNKLQKYYMVSDIASSFLSEFLVNSTLKTGEKLLTNKLSISSMQKEELEEFIEFNTKISFLKNIQIIDFYDAFMKLIGKYLEENEKTKSKYLVYKEKRYYFNIDIENKYYVECGFNEDETNEEDINFIDSIKFSLYTDSFTVENIYEMYHFLESIKEKIMNQITSESFNNCLIKNNNNQKLYKKLKSNNNIHIELQEDNVLCISQFSITQMSDIIKTYVSFLGRVKNVFL